MGKKKVKLNSLNTEFLRCQIVIGCNLQGINLIPIIEELKMRLENPQKTTINDIKIKGQPHELSKPSDSYKN